MMRSNLRWLAAFLAFALVLGACSGGSGDADDVTRPAGQASDVADADAGSESTAEPSSGSSEDDATSGGSTGASTSEGTVTAPSGDEDVQVTTPSDGGPPVADLFTPEEDTIGIHDDKIVLCGHAATSLGSAFGVSEEDLNVYWQEVGEIHGRRVETSWENDNYDPTTARQAAQACKDKDPFMLLGGIGFDQIPAVRKFAEDNHMLYYHHIAREDLSKKYSFSPLPTVEQMGDFAGQYVGTKYKGKKIGVIYRESENWDPGHTTFVNRLKSLGGDIVADIGVQNGQGSYFTEVNELNSKGAELVFLWENALAGTNIIQQAKGQNYHPKWLVFPFNLETDVLGDQALNPPIEGISVWPAYSIGDRSGPFAEYADELERFEDAYERRRPGVEPTDIHWMVWMAWKGLHQTLEACGRDCTRNKVVGLSLERPLSFEETSPNCPVDFTRNGHVGGFWASIFTAYERADGDAGWRHVPGMVCRESFL